MLKAMDEKSVGDVLDTIPYAPEGEGNKVSSRPTVIPTKPVTAPSAKPKTRIPLPTLANAEKKQKETKQNSDNFSEHHNLDAAFKSASPVKAKLSKLKDQTPEKRAEIGAKFGAGMGLATSGPHGAVLGAAIGAHAARSLGALQSGEHEINNRREKVLENFKTLGIVDKKGKINFEDGVSINLTNDPSLKLKNVNPVALRGEKDRPLHKIDKSHPMANRTATVARPIARYIAGQSGFSNDENPKDMQTIDQTTAIVMNILQEKVDSIDKVYGRARELVKKLKCNEVHMRSFFNALKSKISEQEAGEIKKGLDILYA